MTGTKKAMEKLRKKMEEPPKECHPYLNKPLRTLKQAQADIAKTKKSRGK